MKTLEFAQLNSANFVIKRSSESISAERPPLQPGTAELGNLDGALRTASGEGAEMLAIAGAVSTFCWALTTALPLLAQIHCISMLV